MVPPLIGVGPGCWVLGTTRSADVPVCDPAFGNAGLRAYRCPPTEHPRRTPNFLGFSTRRRGPNVAQVRVWLSVDPRRCCARQRLPHLPGRVSPRPAGVGTGRPRARAGCRGFTGPVPSAALDKTGHTMNPTEAYCTDRHRKVKNGGCRGGMRGVQPSHQFGRAGATGPSLRPSGKWRIANGEWYPISLPPPVAPSRGQDEGRHIGLPLPLPAHPPTCLSADLPTLASCIPHLVSC